MLPAIAAAVHAFAAALPTAAPAVAAAAPFVLATAVGFGVVASHTPSPDILTLKGTPEVAAECIKRNAASHVTKLAALVQPLYGAGIYSVVLKRGGVTGDPTITGVIQEAGSGSTAEFRSLSPQDQQNEVIAQMIAGC